MTVTVLLRLAEVTAADAGRRLIRGRVMPYGEVGNPNVGPLWVRSPGRLRLPPDLAHVVLLLGHDRPARPVGIATAAEDTPDGLDMTFRIASTPDGDQALAEAGDPEAPVRTGLSVELDNVRYDDDGGLASADVLAVALVPVPAFDTARVADVQAARHPSQEGTAPVKFRTSRARTLRDVVEGGGGAPVATAVEQAAPAPAVVPDGLPFAAPPAAATAERTATVLAAAAGVPDLRALAGYAAAYFRGERTPAVMAALTAATQASNPYVAPDAYAGELWAGNTYTRSWVGLFAPAPLTHWKVNGWRWVTKPKVARYNPASGGNASMAEIPTNAVATEPVNASAVRFAGGHKIDRKYLDFNDSEFVLSFLAAKTESYAEETDAYARESLLGYITELWSEPGASAFTPTAALPPGFATVGKPATLLKAGMLASAILRETPNVRQRPDFMLVNTLDWLELGNILGEQVPAFLAMLGVTPDSLVPDLAVPRGDLVAGVRQAQKFRELPGAAPVRVQAMDLAHAAVDDALFGYAHAMNERPGGVITVPFGALVA